MFHIIIPTIIITITYDIIKYMDEKLISLRFKQFVIFFIILYVSTIYIILIQFKYQNYILELAKIISDIEVITITIKRFLLFPRC